MKVDGLPVCERCGYCCEVYSLEFCKEDLERWWGLMFGKTSVIEDIEEWRSDTIGKGSAGDLNVWLIETPSVPVPSNLGTYPIFDFIAFVRQDLLRGDLWFHPKTGEELDRCPFLRKVPKTEKYRCMIYELRPEICRQHPGRCPERTYGAVRGLKRFQGIAGVEGLRRHFNKLQEKEQCDRKNGKG